jgi:predicted tellurium resistance membrane protein TerC
MQFTGYELVMTFVTLTFLEIILGIDNLIFIALVTQKLHQKIRNSARVFGLFLALIIRVLMLFSLSWIMTLTDPLFYLFGNPFSFKNFLLISGGLFLIVKSGYEIFNEIYLHKEHHHLPKKDSREARDSLIAAILQIVVVDFIFSFDSIITAIAISNNISIIIASVVIAMFVMLYSSEKIGNFLQKYSSLKIIALAFIFMVGVILLADGFYIHIEKGYLYFSLFFATAVEWINIIVRKKNHKSVS